MKRIMPLIFLVALLWQSKAQTVTTVAGDNIYGGSAANQLNSPMAVFVDAIGYIYVADAGNNRVQKFPPNSNSMTNGVTVAGGNGKGHAPNQLFNPGSIYVDNNGDLYVADVSNNRVQKFPLGSDSTTNGVTVAGGNGQGSAPNQFIIAASIWIDKNGNLYVADMNNNRIQMFPPGSDSSTNGVTVAGGNGYGFAANQLPNPQWVFVDTSGYIYVVDDGSVVKFPPGSDSTTNGVTIAGPNIGSGPNQLNGVTSVFVDRNGYVYVSDMGNWRIQKYPPGSNSNTDAITVAGGNGRGQAANQLNQAEGIFVDTANNIYVADWNNNRIQKWSQYPDGISNILLSEPISIYPNPNTGSFILQSSGSIGSEYVIYDMIGRAVAQGTITSDKQNIDLAVPPSPSEGVGVRTISAGSYTLDVQGNKAIRFVIGN